MSQGQYAMILLLIGMKKIKGGDTLTKKEDMKQISDLMDEKFSCLLRAEWMKNLLHQKTG